MSGPLDAPRSFFSKPSTSMKAAPTKKNNKRSTTETKKRPRKTKKLDKPSKTKEDKPSSSVVKKKKCTPKKKLDHVALPPPSFDQDESPSFETLVAKKLQQFTDLYKHLSKTSNGDRRWLRPQMKFVELCCTAILYPAGCPYVPERVDWDKESWVRWLMDGETLKLIGEALISYKDTIVRPTRMTADLTLLTVQEVFVWFFFRQYSTPKFMGKNVCPKCGKILRLIRKESRLICTCSNKTYFYANMTFANSDFGATRMNVTHHYKRAKFFEDCLLPYKQGAKPIEEADLLKIMCVLNERRQKTNRHEWKAKMIKSVLKKLNLYTKYKHCEPIIARRLAGKNSSCCLVLHVFERCIFPFDLVGDFVHEFTQEQFNEIMARVNILIAAYMEIGKGERNTKRIQRNNFPKFTYITNKICMQNGWKDLAKQFSLQKIQDKLKKQEKDWKVLIDYLITHDFTFEWKFISSFN